jgi:hypothetical protein
MWVLGAVYFFVILFFFARSDLVVSSDLLTTRGVTPMQGCDWNELGRGIGCRTFDLVELAKIQLFLLNTVFSSGIS